MNISIITFHFAYNYGAVLQAWALHHKLLNDGHQVSIINYKPRYHTSRYSVHRSILQALQKGFNKKQTDSISKRIICAIRAVGGTAIENVVDYRKRVSKKQYFELFCHKNFNLTRKYNSIEELKRNPPVCDVYIAGSDQIWNQKITNGRFDDAYFLSFGSQKIKRLIYATSLGETTAQECCEYIKDNSICLDAISCREYDDAKEIAKNLEQKCCCIPDPTLLLEADDYGLIEETIEETGGPYILVYILKKNPVLDKAIEYIHVNTEIKIIDISPNFSNINGIIKKDNISPGQFLSYIKNAMCVITNSFHGTVFSILYQREFICGAHQTRNSRIEYILKELSLDERMVFNLQDFKDTVTKQIKYEDVLPKLNQLRKKGDEFLQENIKDFH